MCRLAHAALVFVLLVLVAQPAFAQSDPASASARDESQTSYGETSPKRQAIESREGGPPVPENPTVTGYFRDLSRVESWSFFEPRPGGGDPTYTFLANRATLGVRVNSRRLDVEGAFQYAQIIGLPPNAIGPGALGTGGFYFFAAENTEAYQLYFKTMMFRLKDLVPGVSLSAGRMSYSSGEETASGSSSLDALKRMRLGSRMIGDFEWSIFERSFDGARLDVDRPSWSATAALLFPTQGGYEESANPTMSSVKVWSATATAKPALLPHQEVQIFGYHYRDQRDVRVRPDNTGLVPRAADVDVATFGASQAGVFPLRRVEIDTVFWGAVQTGDWYRQAHRAASVAAEAGIRMSSAAWRPWFRGGFLHASGDGNPRDARHGTFFPMLPTVRRYALSTAYSTMNIRDRFGSVAVQPHDNVAARVEVHRLSLADAADRWYTGSGATSRNAMFFGFTGRQSNGASSLGTVVEGSADIRLNPRWSMNGYVGWMKGGDVVRRLFADDRLVFFYLENVLSF